MSKVARVVNRAYYEARKHHDKSLEGANNRYLEWRMSRKLIAFVDGLKASEASNDAFNSVSFCHHAHTDRYRTPCAEVEAERPSYL